MKRTTWVLLALLATGSLAAQDAMKEKYEEKLAKEFATKVAWAKTLADAQTQAKEKNALIYGYFTRSYAP